MFIILYDTSTNTDLNMAIKRTYFVIMFKIKLTGTIYSLIIKNIGMLIVPSVYSSLIIQTFER